MANINLLPWREQQRGERKHQFLVSLGLTVAVAALLLFAADRFFVSKISNQNARNQYLSEQIAALDREIVEIRQLQEQKRELTARMKVIQNLQGMRPVIVRLFDELVRSLPDGVYFSNVSSDERTISIQGNAESNSRVSALMRALDEADWFSDSRLRQVAAVPGATNAAGIQDEEGNSFQLTVMITAPEEAAP
ncbi:MAG TPA: pilus assembly protein PilN [Pseudomonadaceae bacterium]|nr:pilus assembly protein PilN [Pseudomonadaceae bacterium]